MAGDTGHYQRKSNDRRDSVKQQNRKNSVGRQKENVQRSTASSPGAAGSYTKPQASKIRHQSVNGFNAQEVEHHLHNKFQAVISAHHDHTLSERERPEKYSSGESAWGVKGGVQSAWGDSKGTLMASGQDFLAELKKALQ
ncbi:unnamed protein product [Umbelopsis vinacea]